jgi:hypothetical protein
MKRIRRVYLRAEHREVSVTITQTTEGGGGVAAWPDSGGGVSPDVCPECGSFWTTDLQSALKELSTHLASLQSAILDHRLHSYWMPDGQVRVCERSLKAIKETQL